MKVKVLRNQYENTGDPQLVRFQLVRSLAECGLQTKVCPNKMASWCMLMTMKYMCQNTCFKEKRPKLVQETSGTMFLRPDLKLFLEFLKTN